MSKKNKVYKKEYKLIAECETQKEARLLIKSIKIRDEITTHNDFKIISE